MARGEGRAQGLARVAVVIRAGAAPLWWAGVFAAGDGVLVPGLTGRRIGVMAGAVLFILAVAVVSTVRRGRYAGLARAAARAGKHDVLQDRAVSVRNWRRGHRWSGNRARTPTVAPGVTECRHCGNEQPRPASRKTSSSH